MTPREEQALRRAVAVLKGKSFVARLTDLTGQPLTQLLNRLPKPVLGPRGQLEPPAALFQIASGVTGALSDGVVVHDHPHGRSIAGIAVHGALAKTESERLAMDRRVRAGGDAARVRS